MFAQIEREAKKDAIDLLEEDYADWAYQHISVTRFYEYLEEFWETVQELDIGADYTFICIACVEGIYRGIEMNDYAQVRRFFRILHTILD